MGSELLRIAEGFSIVAEGLRGLAKAEGSTKDKAAVKEQKQDAAKTQPEAQQEKPATLEGIRALMAQKTQEKGTGKEQRGEARITENVQGNLILKVCAPCFGRAFF